ncbi:MAG: tRNA pseudouridine(38-40) synthase TruA [Planctomycetota bacterium]
MHTYKLTLAYDGTNFSGWQAQPKRRTVQGVLRVAWREITGEDPRMTATSRTDAGVHALGQVVGIRTTSELPPERLLGGVNAKLPEDVVLRSVEVAADEFHATHDAIGKRYRYSIHNSRLRPLLDRHLVWHIPQLLDVDAMHMAGQLLVGTQDFASFQSVGSPRDCTVRTVTDVEVGQGGAEDPDRITIDVSGDGFLYNMVRNIVGTLVDVGAGRRPPEWVSEVVAAVDRQAAGQTAPPQGLMLMEVEF